jgi:hypothetical protein
MSENNIYFRGLHKIWKKIISFGMRKKGEMYDMSWKKKTVNLKALRIQMWYPNHAWTLMYKGYLQELKINQVSNSLRQLALKI